MARSSSAATASAAPPGTALKELLPPKEAKAMAGFGVRDLDTMLRFPRAATRAPPRCVPSTRSPRGRR